MQAKTVFVTGGTGFLGSFLIAFLLQQGYRVAALVRGPDPVRRLVRILRTTASQFRVGSLEEDSSLSDSLLPTLNLRVVEGDVRAPGFGMASDMQRGLVREVEEIWHCAASFKFRERDREEIVAHNVAGTRHLLEFARRCNRGKEVPVFYVSTAYVAPVSLGMAREELPSEGAPYRNLYEWSKQEAERLVDRFRQEYHLPAIILRPTVIIGHSLTGKAVRFTGYYDILKALYLLKQNLAVNLLIGSLRIRIAARPDLPGNLVPVDFVVKAMWHVARARQGDACIFHIAHDSPVPLARLFDIACRALHLSGIELAGEKALQEKPLTLLERFFNQRVQFQAPYLLDSPLFETPHFRRLVPREVLPCPQVDEKLLCRVNRYCFRVLNRQFGGSHEDL